MVIFEGISPDSKTLHYILKTGGKGNMIVQNPKRKNQRQALRYASNQPSPWMVDQVGPCILPAIVMEEGYLKVDESETALLTFLRLSDQYGVDYREVDPERDAIELMANDEKILRIKAAILAKSEEPHGDVSLGSLLAMMSNNDYTVDQIDAMGPNQVRQILYTIAGNEPDDFVDSKGKVTCFTNNDFIFQDLVIRALSKDIISISLTGREIFWNNGEKIIDVPTGKDSKVFLADFFLSNDGAKVMNTIAEGLEKLGKKK